MTKMGYQKTYPRPCNGSSLNNMSCDKDGLPEKYTYKIKKVKGPIKKIETNKSL